MKYAVLTLLAAVAVWYFFIRGDSTSSSAAAPQPPPRPPTPEQQFQTLLSGDTVDAAQLAALCSSYPQLAARALNGRQIRIKGTIADVQSSGIDGRRADLLLSGGGQRKIMLICDLDQYNSPSVNFRFVGRFEAVGPELLYLVQRDSTLTKKVVATQGSSINQSCSLKSMGMSFVEFQMVNGPEWARAEAKTENNR